MVTKKKINYIHELQDIQRAAVECLCDVGLHSEDGSMIIPPPASSRSELRIFGYICWVSTCAE